MNLSLRRFSLSRMVLMGAILILLLSLTAISSGAFATDLFFSEYIEGSSFNKAVEIYNGTGAAVDLSTYSVELYSNGASSPSQSVTLSGTLADGDVFVLAHGSADAAILAVADLVNNSVINFNGDDAVVLRKGSVVVDAFGQIGFDPGSQWDGGGQDDTLRRAETVCAGDTNANDAFDASLEWVVFANNTFDGLGSHTANCGGGSSATDVFMSEYIEGSSFNKAIEIYNGTDSAIDLGAGNYTLELYSNGSATVSQSLALTGTIAAGDVFVLAHPSAAPAILAEADVTNGSVINFNGDDAVVLRKSGAVVDAFGQIGVDPGSQWTGGGQDDTLRRAEAVCAGDTNADDAFDASVEWVVFANNTFDGLGSHTANCGGGGPTPGQALPLSEGFADCTLAGWEIISVDADLSNTWSCNSFYSNIEANGYGDTAPANEWLITPALNMNAQVNDTLTFRSHTSYTDINYPQVHVLYSTDYDGGGDPTSATWTELTGITFSPANSSLWTDSGQVDLSGISGTNVYFAFQYVSSGTGSGTAARWRLDGINFFEYVEACGDPFTPIYTVQGNGSASLLVGTEVAVEGVVVGDFQNNASEDSGDLNGFFVQDLAGDSDATTSDAVFVYAPGGMDVSVGDAVRVRGNVSEYHNLTEIGASQIWQCSTGNSVPAPVSLSLPVNSVDDFEAYEGMLVAFPQDLVISEYFNYDRYGEIVLTSERHLTPTAEFEPGSPEAALAAQDYLLDKITLDDGRSAQNPDPAIHPNGEVFNLDNLFRGGDIVANVTGLLDQFDAPYRVQPIQGADYISDNPRTENPDDVGGSVKVASFNVLNYFTTLDDSGPICGPDQDQDCRGADNETEFTRQRDKIIAAISVIDADVVGLIEIENHPGDVPVADLVSGLNDVMGSGTYDYIATGAIGTDAIRQAFIYKPASVTPMGDFAVLDTSVDPRFLDDFNRPALAQTFIDNSTGGVFTAVVNHLKSKGSDCNAIGDPDTGDGAGNCNLTRKAAAEALVDWLAGDPTGSYDEDFLIIGDLNSYDKEDPIDAILAGSDDILGTEDDYTDLVFTFIGEDAYSYVFDGQLGYLDHGLANAALEAKVSGLTIWHINADEPDLIDYDTSFKQAAQDAIYAPDAYRSSDHDPVIVGLGLTTEQEIQEMMDYVQALVDDGILNDGQGNSLLSKLENVLAKLDKGQTKAALNQLGALINQLEDFIAEGILTADQAAPLIVSAEVIIFALGG